jgi:hypothetical protein
MGNSRRKTKRTPTKRRHPSTPAEVLIESKRKALIKAEREYWRYQQQFRRNFNAIASVLAEEPHLLPEEISSIVWGLRDGAAFVRYKSFNKQPGVEFRVWDIPLEEWATKGLILPVEKGEISLASAGLIRGLGTITMNSFKLFLRKNSRIQKNYS